MIKFPYLQLFGGLAIDLFLHVRNLSSKLMVDPTIKSKAIIHSILSEYSLEQNIKITNEALLGLSDIILMKSRLFGRDLEMFTRHGKRQTINMEDVKLLCRNNPQLLNKSL